jgi:hypothetical protein
MIPYMHTNVDVQRTIANKLLADKSNYGALFKTKFDAGEVYVDTGNGVMMPLSKSVQHDACFRSVTGRRFAECGLSEEHHNTVKLDKHSKQFEEYNFFITQLDLLSKLAYDNDHAIEVITSLFSFEECFSCLQVRGRT